LPLAKTLSIGSTNVIFMRRRILVPIRDDPEPTEDEARLGLLNWLSQPRVISSPEDTQLLSIFAARNIGSNGRASMVHPYKTCYANVDEAKSELVVLFYDYFTKYLSELGATLEDFSWSYDSSGNLQLKYEEDTPGNSVLAAIQLQDAEVSFESVMEAITESLIP
jgi:hypothetical protein